MTMISAGCANRALVAAATERGTAEARVTLPPYPKDCREKEAHAPLVVGAEVRSILKRERLSLDRQNNRTDRCAQFYDDLEVSIR